jgi:hypothetical protein
MNTLTAQNFQDAFKNGGKRICMEGDYVEGDGGQ